MCSQSKTINGVTYRPYGPLNEGLYKDPKVKYQIRMGPLVSGIVFIECIIQPVYIFGYNLYEPVGLKPVSDSSKH